MQPFTYNVLPSRVIFGTGTLAQVPQEMKALGCSKALILTGPNHAHQGKLLCNLMGNLAVGLYDNATMHTPVKVTEDAMRVVRSLGADCVIALGGGTSIGLGKAIALRTDLPQIVLPTTYSGSEVRLVLLVVLT
jgi:maleylacetate reductase